MATRKGMCYAIVEKKGTQNNMEGKAFCDGWFHRTVGFLGMNLFLIFNSCRPYQESGLCKKQSLTRVFLALGKKWCADKLHGLPWQGEERMAKERACSLERRKVVPQSDRINTCRS